MQRLPKEIPFRGDERPTRKIIEVSSGNSEVAILTNGIETRALRRDRLTWGGDFAGYVQFQAQNKGRWPTPEEQVGIRDAARRNAFSTASPLPEPEPDDKCNFS